MLAWGNRVSPEFRAKVKEMAERLETDPDWLMAAMAFETGETFSPSVKNGAGSGAVGLIQFMPATARTLGTTTDFLGRMKPEEQLYYVESYLKPYKGKLKTLEDVYMAILWPAAIGKPLDHVLFRKDDPKAPKRYIQNKGLDFNMDGVVTKAKAAEKVRKKLEKGLMSECRL
ncbi:transglycosylase SLT domain-containing protein [Desulforegula conservatrix]|uniref:transglycosylase SLT domain-containing protein n=1 Tax=Desulforegula conservatrix TaxID=153026 RepID=UPI0004196311|nr:transglycosylase SLT domain-containing protein [Desulforegula conservatrix]